MRRSLFAVILAAVFVSSGVTFLGSGSSALAAGHATKTKWNVYSSKQFSMTFRYPANWKVTQTYSKLIKQVWLIYTGMQAYSMSISILPINPGPNVKTTVARFVAMQKQGGNTAIARMKWTATTLGGVPAMSGVASSKTSTEGGLTLSAGIYIVRWKNRTYEIIIQANHRPPLTQLSQFPKLYQQILQTWHFTA